MTVAATPSLANRPDTVLDEGHTFCLSLGEGGELECTSYAIAGPRAVEDEPISVRFKHPGAAAVSWEIPLTELRNVAHGLDYIIGRFEARLLRQVPPT